MGCSCKIKWTGFNMPPILWNTWASTGWPVLELLINTFHESTQTRRWLTGRHDYSFIEFAVYGDNYCLELLFLQFIYFSSRRELNFHLHPFSSLHTCSPGHGEPRSFWPMKSNRSSQVSPSWDTWVTWDTLTVIREQVWYIAEYLR